MILVLVSEKIKLGVSSGTSTRQTIHMKCLNLFSLKNVIWQAHLLDLVGINLSADEISKYS